MTRRNPRNPLRNVYKMASILVQTFKQTLQPFSEADAIAAGNRGIFFHIKQEFKRVLEFGRVV